MAGKCVENVATTQAKNIAIHMMWFDGCEAATDRYVYVRPHATNTIRLFLSISCLNAFNMFRCEYLKRTYRVNYVYTYSIITRIISQAHQSPLALTRYTSTTHSQINESICNLSLSILWVDGGAGERDSIYINLWQRTFNTCVRLGATFKGVELVTMGTL